MHLILFYLSFIQKNRILYERVKSINIQRNIQCEDNSLVRTDIEERKFG